MGNVVNEYKEITDLLCYRVVLVLHAALTDALSDLQQRHVKFYDNPKTR